MLSVVILYKAATYESHRVGQQELFHAESGEIRDVGQDVDHHHNGHSDQNTEGDVSAGIRAHIKLYTVNKPLTLTRNIHLHVLYFTDNFFVRSSIYACMTCVYI